LNESEEIFGQFCENGDQFFDSGPLFDGPSRQTLLEVLEALGVIDPVALLGLEVEVLFDGAKDSQDIEVVA